jgi:hypothetical protein
MDEAPHGQPGFAILFHFLRNLPEIGQFSEHAPSRDDTSDANHAARIAIDPSLRFPQAVVSHP